MKAELSMVTKERDEIRDRLKEFEIISDDLANLKRLQQENEQLKRSLSAQGLSAPVAAPAPTPASPEQNVAELFDDMASADAPAEDDNAALEDFLSSPDEPTEPAAAGEEAVAAAPTDEKKAERTPEDLLSEFEKMLG